MTGGTSGRISLSDRLRSLRYAAPADTVWYHFFFGHIPRHKQDLIYSPLVPHEELRPVHYSHLGEHMRALDCVGSGAFALVFANLSRHDSRFVPTQGGLGVALAVRVAEVVDHAGRSGAAFAHGVATVKRRFTAGDLEMVATQLRRHMVARGPTLAGIDAYRAYYEAGQTAPSEAEGFLRRYMATIGDLPRGETGPPASYWGVEGTGPHSQILITYSDADSEDAIFGSAARLAALLAQSDVRWSAIGIGCKNPLTEPVSILFAPEGRPLGDAKPDLRCPLAALPHDDQELMSRLFRAVQRPFASLLPSRRAVVAPTPNRARPEEPDRSSLREGTPELEALRERAPRQLSPTPVGEPRPVHADDIADAVSALTMGAADRMAPEPAARGLWEAEAPARSAPDAADLLPTAGRRTPVAAGPRPQATLGDFDDRPTEVDGSSPGRLGALDVAAEAPTEDWDRHRGATATATTRAADDPSVPPPVPPGNEVTQVIAHRVAAIPFGPMPSPADNRPGEGEDLRPRGPWKKILAPLLLIGGPVSLFVLWLSTTSPITSPPPVALVDVAQEGAASPESGPLPKDTPIPRSQPETPPPTRRGPAPAVQSPARYRGAKKGSTGKVPPGARPPASAGVAPPPLTRDDSPPPPAPKDGGTPSAPAPGKGSDAAGQRGGTAVTTEEGDEQEDLLIGDSNRSRRPALDGGVGRVASPRAADAASPAQEPR